MAEKILGPHGSKRRKRFLWVPMLLIACTALFVIGSAQAVHDAGVFELDGNAVQGVNSTPPMPTATEDADNICAAFAQTITTGDGNPAGPFCNQPGATTLPGATSSTRASFVTDGNGQFASGANDDQWTGGSKDDQNIEDWVYKQAASSNDKSDIENAFAAVYTAPANGRPEAGHKIIYFGGTRTSNSGSENTAFWFLQNAVSENPNTSTGCTLNSGCPFTGSHVAASAGADGCLTQGSLSVQMVTVGSVKAGTSPCTETDLTADTGGDVLIVSAFSVGGTQPNTTAYEFVGVNNAPKAFCVTSKCSVLQITPVVSGCDPNFTNDPVCAITNQNVQYPNCPTGSPLPPCVAGNPEPIPSPWIFGEKSSDSATSGASACQVAANHMCPGIFFEGGLDLSALGLGGECTSTFTMDTRSSGSVDASLQDLAIGQLGSCTSSLVTTPKTGAGGDIPSGGIQLGTDGKATATDSALLTVNGPASFIGQIQFTLCGKIAITANCATGGTDIGSPVTANSNGTYTSPVATVTRAANNTTRAPGHYCWRATFTSTTSGVPPASDPKSDSTSISECFLVKPVLPTLTTCAGTIDAVTGACTAATAVDFGNAVNDHAVLAGTAHKPGPSDIGTTAGGVATGTITFTLFKANCTDLAVAKSGSVSAANPQTVSVTSGDGTYNAASFTPDAPGTYHWVATYGGDDPNTLPSDPAAADATCGTDANEDVTIRTIPSSITTTQKVTPQDSATVTDTVTGNNLPAGGVVTFYLYGPTAGSTALANCQAHTTVVGTAGLLYSAPFTIAAAAHTATFDTANTVSVNANDSVYWRVTYSTGDTAHTGIQSDCVEHTDTTFTNEAGPGTAFP